MTFDLIANPRNSANQSVWLLKSFAAHKNRGAFPVILKPYNVLLDTYLRIWGSPNSFQSINWCPNTHVEKKPYRFEEAADQAEVNKAALMMEGSPLIPAVCMLPGVTQALVSSLIPWSEVSKAAYAMTKGDLAPVDTAIESLGSFDGTSTASNQEDAWFNMHSFSDLESVLVAHR